jgi:hypothetical protein
MDTLLENRPFIDQNNWSKSKMVEIIDQKTICQNYRLVDCIDQTEHWSILSTQKVIDYQTYYWSILSTNNQFGRKYRPILQMVNTIDHNFLEQNNLS